MFFKYLWLPIDIIGCNLFGPQFIGGKTLNEVLECGSSLKKQGYEVTYSLLGEHVHDPDILRKAVATMLVLLQGMEDENSGNICCKPTLFGLDTSEESKVIFQDYLEKMLIVAKEKKVEVEIDAESYRYIPDTFSTFHFFANQPRYHKFIRQAVQAHLKDIFELMGKHKLWNKQLRIVKGSGVYEEDLAFTEENDDATKDRYLEILKHNSFCGQLPFAATVRDRKLSQRVIQVTGGNNDIFEFQMMFGPFGKKLSKALLDLGYTVRIYIPFVATWCKDVWKPYGLRRSQMLRHILWEEIKEKIGI